ncbi:bifunctional 2',3'-cyclic-nucleotide 2'-phosphodiesterase/3'-nucleotidase [Aliidiomarina indica]|uniref:bifunctional 2',3'-cyclic-nucleotide 2'-phosphodiesterase/3'-nucleotidase n=1 Tax=Aliidiomarina indica TaxID=2749147 RepID=UPI00188FBC82|nr:bifunctional 2',3'-cyclic-nucleotide 2'-phosphodiesterase/3'-nucleotidase [Aliidiomarina indica]
MNRIQHHLGLIATCMILTLVGCSEGSHIPENNDEPARIQVRLLETTDLHAYMLGYDYFRQQETNTYGLAHTAVLIHEARAENPNHVLIDNGDLIQGSALGDWTAGRGTDYLQSRVHPVIKALNYLEYDVANLGNHEFNYGLEFLLATIEDATFPFVSANAFYADSPETSGKYSGSWGEPLVPPYVILDRDFIDQRGETHVIRIGVIGFVPPQIMRWDAQHLRHKVQVRDMVSAAQHFIPKMKAEGADIVVAVPHSGLRIYSDYPKFAEQASYQLAGVSGIDAILFGHQHQLFPGSPAYNDLPEVDNVSGYVRGIPAVSPGYWGDHLGIIDLTLEAYSGGWRVAQSDVQVRAIDNRKDDALIALLETEQAATLAMLNTPLGELEQRVSSLFARIRPESSVQLINDAQTWYVRQLQQQGELDASLPVLSAAAPFRNGSQSPEDYTLIEAGPFTLGNLVDLYVYPNTLQVVELSGKQIREWLEMSANAFRHIDPELNSPQPLFARFPSYNFDMLTGITYTIDPTQPARYSTQGDLQNPDSHRIYNLRYQGAPIAEEQRFLVATNNYRAGGGGNFPNLDGSTLVYASDAEVRQVIADYARNATEETDGLLAVAVESNWQLRIPDGVVLEFRGSPSAAAREEARHIPGLSIQSMDDEGYRLYWLRRDE